MSPATKYVIHFTVLALLVLLCWVLNRQGRNAWRNVGLVLIGVWLGMVQHYCGWIVRT